MKNLRLIIYQSEDSKVKIEPHFVNERDMRKIGNSDFSSKQWICRL